MLTNEQRTEIYKKARPSWNKVMKLTEKAVIEAIRKKIGKFTLEGLRIGANDTYVLDKLDNWLKQKQEATK